MPSYDIHGFPGLANLIPAIPDRLSALLVNADAPPDAAAIILRCQGFAASQPTSNDVADRLIVTILTAPPPGLDHMGHHAANAALWAFTRQAALEWAPRRIRVNAIGLGTDLAGPFEPSEQAGRATGAAPGAAASLDDIAQTIRAIASWPSMTGQIIRLGV